MDDDKQNKKNALLGSSSHVSSKMIQEEDARSHALNTMGALMQSEAGANRCMKITFFILCCVILFAITGMLIRVLYVMMTYQIPNNSPEFAAEMISMVGAFIAAFMKVIEIIASNLFNLKMQEGIVSILTNKAEQ